MWFIDSPFPAIFYNREARIGFLASQQNRTTDRPIPSLLKRVRAKKNIAHKSKLIKKIFVEEYKSHVTMQLQNGKRTRMVALSFMIRSLGL